ncbi:hypothetical protein ACFV0R_15950 [Streptomyces sp. NPDC059578]|uniref:hypothetical protein n=1 Tax=unclassified Streptomyces TaxID=2593676 RepID=UPI0036526EB2
MGRVTIVDETTSGDRDGGRGLDVAEDRLALRELIRRRVHQEVAEYHAGSGVRFRGLVRPREVEPGQRVDPGAQTERALRAFEGNGLLVLVDDRQITELDEEIPLPSGTEITFLTLVPLVGG